MSADRDRLSTGSDQAPEGARKLPKIPIAQAYTPWRES